MPFVVQNGKGMTPRLSGATLLVVGVDLHANLHCPSEKLWQCGCEECQALRVTAHSWSHQFP